MEGNGGVPFLYHEPVYIYRQLKTAGTVPQEVMYSWYRQWIKPTNNFKIYPGCR